MRARHSSLPCASCCIRAGLVVQNSRELMALQSSMGGEGTCEHTIKRGLMAAVQSLRELMGR